MFVKTNKPKEAYISMIKARDVVCFYDTTSYNIILCFECKATVKAIWSTCIVSDVSALEYLRARS